MHVRNALGLLAVLAVAGTLVWAQDAGPQKKLIEVGWDLPNAERLRANLAVMETTPLQGCGVRFAGPKNSPAMWFSFTREPYDEKVVAQFVEDLKGVEPRQLRDRFLLLNANTGEVDWFDDAGWKIIADHWRTGARVARECGMKGIMFDPEAYRDPYRAFDWSRQAEVEKHTFAEYSDKARQRGRELMTAVAAEHPEATILAFFLLSGVPTAAQVPDPASVLAGSPYGLLPGFVNGWLDVMPPTVTLVDGCESAYRYNSRLDYLTAANLIRNKCQRMVAPENRRKYRAQVQVGFGVYLDAYVNPPTSNWYINPGTQTPVQRLAENVSTALEVADEYVWIYGEQCSWWPTPMPGPDKVRWPQKLPGIEQALRLAVDPVATVLDMMSQPGERENLLTNADFGATTAAPATGPQPADWKQGMAPPGWSFWQAGVSKGKPGWDRQTGRQAPGSGTLTGVSNGCLIGRIDATPGERLAVAAWVRVQGHGAPSAAARWQTPEGKWHAESLDVPLSPARTENGWQLMVAAAVVPEGAGKLVLLLSVAGQRSEQDVAWWDDALAFRLQ